MEQNWTDDQLMTAIKAGGRERDEAWAYISKAWCGVYLSVIRNLGGSPQEVNEIFSYAVEGVDKQIRSGLELHSASLRTYLIEALRRQWANQKDIESRKKKRLKNLEAHSIESQEIEERRDEKGINGPAKEHEPSPEEAFIKEEGRQKVRNALAQLSERCQTIGTYYSLGYSWREIAELLGIGEQNAQNRWGECLRKLRQLLQGKT